MLPRSKKLTRKELEEVIKKGRAIHTPSFWLKSIKSEKLNKLAVIIPSKVEAKAHDRNSFRRRIYQILSPIIPLLQGGYDIVLCAKLSQDKIGLEILDEKVKEIFVKSGFLK